jgi:hypothetical protein
VRALRVRDDNPALDVAGPDRGVHKAKAYLFPSEFRALVSCRKVPAAWRRMYAVTTYLYLRAAEARALEWPDVDMEHGVALIHRTADDSGRLDSTKSQRARRVAIEPALLPMLRRMHARAGGVGRVLPRMPTEKHLAPMLRRHLTAAGVTRADLHNGDATRRALRFHDLRATGITWAAIRGDDPLKIKQRAGHRTFSTTEAYIREAEAVRDGFGDVFPALPVEVVSSADLPERIGANGHAYEIAGDLAVGEAGFEPAVETRNERQSPQIVRVTSAATPAKPDRNPGDSSPPGRTVAKPSPRAAALAALFAQAGEAAAAGDLETAAELHRAAASLLGAAPARQAGATQPEGTEEAAQGGVVLHLERRTLRR